jgi:hypothetical protein
VENFEDAVGAAGTTELSDKLLAFFENQFFLLLVAGEVEHGEGHEGVLLHLFEEAVVFGTHVAIQLKARLGTSYRE